MKSIILLTLTFVLTIESKTYDVTSASELTDALKSVNPGDTINLKSGTYKGDFVAFRSGSKNSPITLAGSGVLSGTNYGFYLKADYWHLRGFEVSDSKKGIVLEGASHNVLEKLVIENIEEEGVHFKRNSADNTLKSSVIRKTSSGKGVYIGESVSNWDNGKQDKSDRNQIIQNSIGPNIYAESVDIKEGSCCGVLQDNVFDGTGSTKTLVEVRGDGYLITQNTAKHSTHGGFKIQHVSDAGVGGCDNSITLNHCSDVSGKCASSSSNSCSNKIENNN